MLFTEKYFAVFFAAYLIAHFIVPVRYRIWLIILGGLTFYAWWRWDYLWVPLLLTLVAYGGARWLDQSTDDATRRKRLWLSVLALFLPLVIVKYSYFALTQVFGLVADPVSLVNPPEAIRWGLPLGISFITFTACAYVVDVYRRRFPVEKDLRLLFGHILFFPHLIAGPILRPHELIPRLRTMRPAKDARFILGLCIFTLGFVKKLVFADQIATAVDFAYSPANHPGLIDYLTAFYGFAVQIYCDFSGYTDMAIGLALAIGMRLPNNFLRPYAAASITEFWRRWHITLSHWLRDYLYIPLGGNRNGVTAQTRNMIITMVLGGLWHGANWTFVIWGLLHGLALSMNHAMSRSLGKGRTLMPRWLGVLVTFHLAAALWVFFRSPDLATAGRFFAGLLQGGMADVNLSLARNVFPILLTVAFFALHRFDRHALLRVAARKVPKPILFVAMAFCWILAIALSQGSSAKFIYFDF
jgi:alginate O-acetyltransferase complex protein AlgI